MSVVAHFLLMVALLANALKPCTATSRYKRDVCNAQKPLINQAVSNKTAFHTNFTFTNDSNTGLMLTWAGADSEVIVLVTTKREDYLHYTFDQPSNIYSSVDGGRTFRNITTLFGKSIYVRSDIGLQRNPQDPSHLLLLGTEHSKLVLWVSMDAGRNWSRSTTVDFDVSYRESLKFFPRATDQVKHWLLAHANDKKLHASLDGGLSWSLLVSNVIDTKWGTSDDLPSAVYVLTDDTGSFFSSQTENKPKVDCCSLRKYELGTSTKRELLTNVHSFVVHESYMFASVWDSSPAGRTTSRRLLKVSADGGRTFQSVQLPTATPDMFYSVLAVDSNQTFIHVDEPGATGKGVLYVSNANGTVYSESLRNHFYPDYLAVYDFMQIKSMRGTYVSTAMNQDSTMYSVITFNRGAEWKRLAKPVNVDCAAGVTWSDCGLQITGAFALGNMYTPVRGSLLLSSETARGIVLAHGHTSATIDTEDPDVYLSIDGGYSWKRVLLGPHYYEIAHFGALLVAAPQAGTSKPGDDYNMLHFSLDGGACWHNFTFESNAYTITGILTAPGNRQLSVALWGFTSDRHWRVHVVNFGELLTQPCAASDYETWIPHVSNGKPSDTTDGCLLGSRDTYRRLRADAWCVADPKKTDLLVTSTVCPCTEDDYDCAYGYYRPTTQSADCVPHPNITTLEVCLHGSLERVISDGYNKIPGDKCVGGYEPHFLDQQLADLKRKCNEADKLQRNLTRDDDGHVMNDAESKAQELKIARDRQASLIENQRSGQNISVLIVVCTIVGVMLVVALALIMLKLHRLKGRTRTRHSYRYSRVPNEDEEPSMRARLLPSNAVADQGVEYDSRQVLSEDDEPLMDAMADDLTGNMQNIAFLPTTTTQGATQHSHSAFK